MTRTTVQAGFDTWADSTHTSDTHGDDKVLHVNSTTQTAYVHVVPPAPRGTRVVSAILTLFTKGDSTGSRTLTAQRVLDPWKARTTNWNNRPTVTATGAATTIVGTLHDKDAVTFDVTSIVQTLVSGAARNYGFSITSTGSHRFYSAQAGVKNPKLFVEYTEGPSAPTDLKPGGLVGVALPTLRWDYISGTDMASFQVQADPAADAVSPDYDSGTVASTTPTHPLTGTTFNQLTFDGSVTYWRVRTTDTGADTSPWSDWAQMTRDDKGTLTIANPAASPNNYVLEPTPPILFALTVETMTAFQVLITDAADRNLIIHDSGKILGSVGAYTLPTRHNNTPLIYSGQSYTLRVRAWDTKQRQGSAAVGDEPYVEAVRDFTLSDDAGEDVPTVSSVEQVGVTPATLVTFTRATAPDSFVVLRDDVEIAVDLAPEDVFVTGTTYAWQDWSAHPRVPHNYTVKAVTNGVQSFPSAPASLQAGTDVADLWVINPNTGRYFALRGDDLGNWQQTDVGTDYWPVGSRTGFRVTQSLGGLAGTFAGEMWDSEAGTVDGMEDDLWRMKATAPHADDFRLVANQLNIPVSISNLTCSPSGAELPGNPIRNVSFSFRQTGEFEFEGQV